MSSDRKRYSPPERGIAALTAEYAVAPARAITPPTAQAARIVPGSRSWAMKPVLKNTPAPIMLATTRPTPGHSPSSLRSRGTLARMVHRVVYVRTLFPSRTSFQVQQGNQLDSCGQSMHAPISYLGRVASRTEPVVTIVQPPHWARTDEATPEVSLPEPNHSRRPSRNGGGGAHSITSGAPVLGWASSTRNACSR